jgi:hypothetical protein
MTNQREIGIIIERPENRAGHVKGIILIKQNVSDWKPGNSGTFLYQWRKKIRMK